MSERTRAEAHHNSRGLIAVETFDPHDDDRLKRWAEHMLHGAADQVDTYKGPEGRSTYLGTFRLVETRWPKWDAPYGCAGRLRLQLEFMAEDRSSSASRQHHIDTGSYLPVKP